MNNNSKFKKQIIDNTEFDVRFIANHKNKAKREAAKYRKQGYICRVRETSPGVFTVYSRSK